MFEQIIQFLKSQYPSSEKNIPTISELQQKSILDKLDLMTDFQSFYLVFDASEQKITFNNGIEKWLGYRNINFKTYIEAIHPTYLKLLIPIAHSGYEISKTVKFNFMDEGLSINIPVKKANSNTYLVCKRNLYAFQINDKGVVTAHLNQYIIIDEVEESQIMSLTPTVINKLGIRQHNLESQLTDFIRKKSFSKDYIIPYSGQEAEILKRYMNDEPSDIICQRMDITKNTMYAYNRRIINKTANTFDIEFSNAKDIAVWLQKQGIKL